MVSAAKLKGDEGRRTTAIAFNTWANALNGPPKLLEGATFEDLPQKVLIVPMGTDQGLCGGVNTFITRYVKTCVKLMAAQGKECDIAIIGDKTRGQLKRVLSDKIKLTLTEVKQPGNFTLAGALASELIANGSGNYDAIVIMYNGFKNAASYLQYYKVIKPFSGEGDGEPLLAYEFEPDTKAEVLNDLEEYLLTSQIYHSLMDSAAAERSARMTAMENASKNAGELIGSLTLKYNRARQSRITTELIEIISGAAALEG